MLRVRVYACFGVSHPEGIPEQRRTSRLFQSLFARKGKKIDLQPVFTSTHVLVSDLLGRCSNNVPLGSWPWDGGLGERENEDIGRLDALFLDT
jgi:hypothetical protein